MVLEGCESGYDLAMPPKRGDSVGDPLFGFGDHFMDGLTQSLECGALRFLEAFQISVDLGA